jgi:DNA-directed RNA polymerase subunit RPC12/RpoP
MSTLAMNITGSFLTSRAAVSTAWPDYGDVQHPTVAIMPPESFDLTTVSAIAVTALAFVWGMLRLAFGRLHALELDHAVDKVFKTGFPLVFWCPVVMRAFSIGPSEVFQFAPLLVVFGFHQIAAKRRELFESGVASTAGHRYARMMLLLGFMFVIDVLAVVSSSSDVARLQDIQQTEAGRTEEPFVNPFTESGTKGPLRVASLLLFHWSMLAIQCANTSLLTSLHFFQSLIHRPDIIAQIRVFVDVSSELLKCATYVGFARRPRVDLELFYLHDFLMSLYLMCQLVRDFKRHRAAMRWVMELPMPTEAQLRGEVEPRTETVAACTSAPPAPGSGEPAQCDICYDGVGDNPQSARCLPCGHIFHVQCLSRWLEKKIACPYCGRDFGMLRRKAYVAAVKARIAAIDAEIAAMDARLAALETRRVQLAHERKLGDAVAGS